jgi:hypothetical protein
MTEATRADTGTQGGDCPLCGGPWIDGRIAVPVVGSLRFVYRLGTYEAATEVVARMCKECGYVHLRGHDPRLIDRAQQAAAHGRAVQRWALRAQRPAGNYRSRYG